MTAFSPIIGTQQGRDGSGVDRWTTFRGTCSTICWYQKRSLSYKMGQKAAIYTWRRSGNDDLSSCTVLDKNYCGRLSEHLRGIKGLQSDKRCFSDLGRPSGLHFGFRHQRQYVTFTVIDFMAIQADPFPSPSRYPSVYRRLCSDASTRGR